MATTPFVKRMRTQGGTIFTFSSALEDIGLNINERNNVVKMSHYALLNIPSIEAPSTIQENKFNVFAIPSAFKYFQSGGNIKDGRVIVAESFQNYALNLESNLLADASYNASFTTTVSERVFWKWLKETGAIRWQSFDNSIGSYWIEEDDSSVGYQSVVKCIGEISAGSVRTNTFGTYNETFVLVPTSFGQTQVYFKQIEDDNYKHGKIIPDGLSYILGRESYLKAHPDALEYYAYYDRTDSSTTVGAYTLEYDDSTGTHTGWWWTAEGLPITTDNTYYTDSNTYLTTGVVNTNLRYNGASDIEFKRSNVDCLSIEFNLSNLKLLPAWGNPPAIDSILSFDKMAIDYSLNDTFDFNAILLYYSVYNKSADVLLATNLLGILFLDPPSGNTQDYPSNQITIPSITKLQSGPSGFGTSYSFRLNVKSDYMLDDTRAEIIDESTSSQLELTNWTEVFDNLGRTLGILNQQTGTLAYITEQYLDITTNQTSILNQITSIENSIKNITEEVNGVDNAIAMFSSGSRPLIESSIYMRNGNIGVFNDRPTWPFLIDASLKAKDIYIENYIRDISGNILLGYGSPLQVGSSTNFKDVNVYTGNPTPAMTLDTSNNVKLNSLSIGDWTFDLDASNNLILHNGAKTYMKFTIDGSIVSLTPEYALDINDTNPA